MHILLSLFVAFIFFWQRRESRSDNYFSSRYSLSAIRFNSSLQLCKHSETVLRCAYEIDSESTIKTRISFVEASKFPDDLRKKLSLRTDLYLPEYVIKRHTRYGKILNETIRPKEISEAAVTTLQFRMTQEHEGSYVCYVIPVDEDLIDLMTLTASLFIELRSSMHYSCFSGVTIMLILLAICCLPSIFCAWRVKRLPKIIFRRIEIEPSSSQFQSIDDLCAEKFRRFEVGDISFLPELRPSVRTLCKAYMSYFLPRRSNRNSIILEHPVASEQALSSDSGLGTQSEQNAGNSYESKEISSKQSDSSLDNKQRVFYILPRDPEFHVSASEIKFEQSIGQGAFGLVFRGLAKSLPRGVEGPMEVAIKTIKDGSNDEDAKDFFRELEILKYIGHHENIIKLYATTSVRGRPCMIMEYASGGSLLDYLRNNQNRLVLRCRHENYSEFLNYAKQVAHAMQYLVMKGVVHRDLAARNVVLTAQDVVKIVDFGLTRKVTEYYRMQSTGCLPVKWMAPESVFKKIFSWKTDVWSFGVMMWELFTFGRTPFVDMSISNYLQLLNLGLCLPKPTWIDEEVYEELMMPCWFHESDKRPDFLKLIVIINTHIGRIVHSLSPLKT